MKQDVAFYFPGQYWSNADWIKNLVLFFDGVAMLVPEYMSDHGSDEDYPIAAVGGIAAFLMSLTDNQQDAGVYSYVFSAQRSLY